MSLRPFLELRRPIEGRLVSLRYHEGSKRKIKIWSCVVRMRGFHVANGVMEMGAVSQLHIIFLIFLDSKQSPGVIKEEF